MQRLVELDVLEPASRVSHAAPCFIQPKPNKTMQFLADFRELNANLERNPFPLPRIDDMISFLGSFNYATKLDLSMGYYHFY